MNGGFCLPCVLFAKHSSDFGQLVSRPLTVFTTAANRLREHDKKAYHRNALMDADTFLRVYSQKQATVEQQMSAHQQQIQKNRKILASLVETIAFCGRQNIALRGHRNEDSAHLRSEEEQSGNPGNFLALVKFRMQCGDEILKKHISTSQGNAMYVSPSIQNQLIGCIGDWILESVLKEVREARFYSVLADEAVDVSVKEQMPLVLRFVDKDDQIREEFVGFVHCDTGTTGSALSEKILFTLKELKLDARMMRGQGYDGAGNMAGKNKGTAALIQKQYPLAVYTHCASHVLNLCIMEAMSIVFVRNMMSTLKEVYLFFHSSAKRQLKLDHFISETSSQKHKLKNLCKTRWVERHEALHTFAELYSVIVQTLDHISHGGSEEEKWDAESTAKASGLLTSCLTFVFRMAFVVCKACLSYVLCISVSLQKKARDVCDAYSEISTVLKAIEQVRECVDEKSKQWFQEAQDMGDPFNAPQPSMPRFCGRQLHRDNIPSDTPEEYFRRSITIPFLDQLIQHLSSRFSALQSTAVRGLCLVPSVLVSLKTSDDLDDLIRMYQDDLPLPATWEAELHRWKLSWQERAGDLPDTAAKALNACNTLHYPNVHTLLQIICTLPVTTSTCERSVSVIRRLKTYLRATMGQERMSGLALMHIHYDIQLDIDEIINGFARISPRRMALENFV